MIYLQFYPMERMFRPLESMFQPLEFTFHCMEEERYRQGKQNCPRRSCLSYQQ